MGRAAPLSLQTVPSSPCPPWRGCPLLGRTRGRLDAGHPSDHTYLTHLLNTCLQTQPHCGVGVRTSTCRLWWGGGCSSAQNTAKFDGPFPERVQFSVELPGCGPQATGCVDPPHCRSHPLAWKVFWFGQSVPRPPSCGRRWAFFRSERIGGPSATFPNLRGQLPEVETFQFPLCVRRWLGTRTGLPFFILNTWPTVTCQALYATFYPHSGPEEGYCCDPPFFGCGTWKPVGLTT